MAGLLVAAPQAAQTVSGRLLDDTTSSAVEGARVSLLDARARVLQQVITPKDGTYLLRAAAPGRYQLRARRMGYATATTPWFVLAAGETRVFELRLSAAPLGLPPITVVGVAPPLPVHDPYLERRGYYQRKIQYGREGIGFGYFLEGNELPATAFDVADLLRDLPGMHVTAAGGTKRIVSGRWCPPDFYLDGVFVGTAGSRGTEELLPPASAIAALEVYPGMVAPPGGMRAAGSLSMGGGCGVVMLWTGIRR
jgi:hypothetical protein